jgi:large subunit ribosomal protein L18e
MPAPTGPSNPQLRKLLEQLRSRGFAEHRPFLLKLARELGRPERIRRDVDLSRIERYAEKGDVVAVPGNVLGAGLLTKPLTVAAWRFSTAAKEKIEKAGGKALSIEQLVEQNPAGTKVRIIC